MRKTWMAAAALGLVQAPVPVVAQTQPAATQAEASVAAIPNSGAKATPSASPHGAANTSPSSNPALETAARVMTPAYKRNFEVAMTTDTPDRVAHYKHMQPLERVPGRSVQGEAGAALEDPQRLWSLPLAAHPELEGEALGRALAQADASQSMAVLVYAKGKVQVRHYGAGFSDQSLFNSYSSHKSILVMAILKAMDDGYLRLEDSVGQYVPAWAQDARRDIRILDLLYNQSGLVVPRFVNEPFNPVLDFFLAEDLQAIVDKLPADKGPGTHFAYNHANAQVLESVLVAATGQRYAAYLSERLWKPMGLADAMVANDRPGGSARGVCCFVNTAPNWLTIGAMLVNDGLHGKTRILSSKAVALMASAAPLRPDQGMYTKRATPESGYVAKDLYYFEGQGGQRLYMVPSLRLAFYRTGVIDHKWDDVTFANAMVASLGQTAGVSGGKGPALALNAGNIEK